MGGGKGSLESRHILKVETIGFADRFEMCNVSEREESRVMVRFGAEQLGQSPHSPKRQRLRWGTGFGGKNKSLVIDTLNLRCSLCICYVLNCVASKFMC